MRLYSTLLLLTCSGLNHFITSVSAQCQRVTVRKELYDMTPDDWQIYRDTIRQAAQTPGRNGLTLWEEFSQVHVQYADETHGTCLFLAYHRYFMRWAELRLQEINPNFAWFYWDSGREYNRIPSSMIWQYLGTIRGEVQGSPLDGIQFGVQHPELLSQTLRRDTDLSTLGVFPSVELLNTIGSQAMSRGGYGWYTSQIETQHGVLHDRIGGDRGQLSSMWSPLDPLFWAHHGHYDWLWSNAQARWRTRGLQYSTGGQTASGATCNYDTPLPGFRGVRIRHVLNTTANCVVYQRPMRRPNSRPRVFEQELRNLDTPSNASSSSSNSSPALSYMRLSFTGSSLETLTRNLVSNATNNSTSGTNNIAPIQSYLPPSYVPVSECPKDPSSRWVTMQFKHSTANGTAVMQEAKELCQDVVQNVQRGNFSIDIVINSADPKALLDPSATTSALASSSTISAVPTTTSAAAMMTTLATVSTPTSSPSSSTPVVVRFSSAASSSTTMPSPSSSTPIAVPPTLAVTNPIFISPSPQTTSTTPMASSTAFAIQATAFTSASTTASVASPPPIMPIMTASSTTTALLPTNDVKPFMNSAKASNLINIFESLALISVSVVLLL